MQQVIYDIMLKQYFAQKACTVTWYSCPSTRAVALSRL